MDRCPGQDKGNLTVSEVRCPNCNGAIEIWSDEASGKCHDCKAIICNHVRKDCRLWCNLC